jgi:hypothetical protein
MKIFDSLFFFSLLMFATTCNKNNDLSIEQDYSLDIGYSVSFNKDELRIRFFEVLQDFRCPPNADCDAPDRLEVRLIISENGKNNNFDFSAYEPVHMDTTIATSFGDFLLEIKEINPDIGYPIPPPEEYNVVFSLKEL